MIQKKIEMSDFFTTAGKYLLHVGLTTAIQIFILLGPLLILAFLMHYIAQTNEKLSYKVLGQKGYLYIFGWLGTAVHELGHAFFALIFLHKITDIQLFSAKAHGGSLGYVSHSYNKKSFYQNFGNFFIGIGPILFGSLMLFLISYILFGMTFKQISTASITSQSFTSWASVHQLTHAIYIGFINYFHIVFGSHSWWKISILVFFLYSVGSSITLSSSDVSGAFSGFIYFVVILLVFNLLTLWIGDYATHAFVWCGNYFSGFNFLILLSMVVNIGFILVLVVINLIKSMF